jgi:hypothetical protein
MIWKILKDDGLMAYKFDVIAQLGMKHFDSIYKEESKVIIVEVVKMSSYLQSFVNEKHNQMLREEIL